MRAALLCTGVCTGLWLVPGCNQRRGSTVVDEDLGAAVEDDLSAGDIDLRGAGDTDLRGTGDPDLRGTGDPDLRGTGGPDLRAPDPDLRAPDPDLRAPVDLRPPPDLASSRPPCKAPGVSGFAAFRFHYSGSTSALLDAYGLPDSSNWQAVPAYATMFDDALHGGGLSLGSGNWILIRYSVVGMSSITRATLSVYGRSYSVSTSGSFEGWSPIYGGAATPLNSLSNAWPYSWSSVDYTGYVQVGDPIGLTGIRLYPRGNSSSLIVNTVELCIEGT